jgi:DNA-binding response OmpR family regulator
MRKKVLLVDDSPTVLQLERAFLGEGTYELLSAGNGGDAIAAATAHRPDLILLDIMMPGLDGIAVLRELRKRVETSATPIVMVTTKSDEKNMTAALESGCTGYITKPFTRSELLEVVRDNLERNEEAASE